MINNEKLSQSFDPKEFVIFILNINNMLNEIVEKMGGGSLLCVKEEELIRGLVKAEKKHYLDSAYDDFSSVYYENYDKDADV